MSILLIFSFGLAELAYSFYQKKDPVQQRSMKETFDCWQFPSEVINNLTPDCKANWTKVVNDEIVFDVEVSTNKDGLRNTDNSSAKNIKDGLALFFGASNVYGHGLPDDQTIPSMFHQMSGIKNVYNYGGGGFGPQHMLYALEENDMKTKLNYTGAGRKMAIYFYSDGQVTSSIPSLSTISGQSGQFPYYKLDSNNILVRDGILKDKIVSKILLFASKSKLLSQFIYWIEDKTDYSNKNVDYAAQFTIQAAHKFKEIYDSEEFYVVLTPLRSSRSRDRFIEVLKKNNIKYFDYSDLLTDFKPEYKVHPLDTHFSALANKIQTEKLVKDIGF